MSPLQTLLSLAAAAVLLAGCQSTPTPDIQTQAAPNTDFSQYQTFSVTTDPSIEVYGESAPVAKAVTAAIATELAAKGYRQVDSNGDLFINYHAEIDNDIQAFNNAIPITPDRTGYYRSWASLYGPLPQEREGGTTRITYAGAINIDVVDRRANQAVWQGVYRRTLTAEDEDERTKVINNAVKSLLFSLPHHK